MRTVSRRALLQLAAVGAPAAAGAARPLPHLKSLTTGARPISGAEHDARIARVQALMQQQRIAALLLEAGSSLEYFTGVRWWRSERTTAAVIPATGQAVVVTPFFEEPSVRETLKVAADVRSWREDESPFDLIAAAVRERAPSSGPLAVEATTRFFIVDRTTRAAGAAGNVVPAEELVRTCRMVKSAAELALMQTANDVTIAALHHLHGRIEQQVFVVALAGGDAERERRLVLDRRALVP